MPHSATPFARTCVLAFAVLAASVAGCSSGDGGDSGGKAAAPRVQTALPPPSVYVAVGASETAGVGADLPEQAWPEVLLRTRLPEGTAFTNVGIPGATVSQALQQELPRALSVGPTLVTVWLNVNDLIAGVPAQTYETQLRQLVRAVRREGATKVLVANTPPLHILPSYVSCRRQPAGGCGLATLLPPEAVAAAVDSYNAAIRRVTAAEGAILVDLHGASLRSQAAGEWDALVGRDGFHPSTLGHRAVADSFGSAL
ncbi:MAG: SGNH/GDSL hydrolase family protein [Actinomycetota bacterium]|nr:SGNH/GDSL hydrolase family protein [Actinomycetota bacterium]